MTDAYMKWMRFWLESSLRFWLGALGTTDPQRRKLANSTANSVSGDQVSVDVTISNGTISCITLTNPGAGYLPPRTP